MILPVAVILNRFLADDLVFILGILLLLLCDPPRASGTRRLLSWRPVMPNADGNQFYFQTDQARKAYETATACPAGRFERGLIRITPKKGNGGIAHRIIYQQNPGRAEVVEKRNKKPPEGGF